MRQQFGHRIPRFFRSGPHHRGRHRLLPSLPYQSGQRGHADSCQSWRHHIAGTPFMDRHHTLRMHRQAGLGGTPRHSMLCPCDAALGMDRQEEQIHQRCPLLRLDASHGGYVNQQVKGERSSSSYEYSTRWRKIYKCENCSQLWRSHIRIYGVALRKSDSVPAGDQRRRWEPGGRPGQQDINGAS